MSADGGAGMALELHEVSKVYRGKVHALRGIDLEVGRGEVFGLLGPNGAGKSTLIKILMTVIRPSKCTGHMLGHRIGDKSGLRRVGYLPENHKFPAYLTARQALDFYGAMSCVGRRDRRRRAESLLDLVGMSAWGDKKIGGYSKGMRQRIGIAQALINDPELVLLDEPTDGVDPGGRRDIRQMLEHIRDEGRTVFLNSHILSELEQVCDRVAILVQGRVASQGTIGKLTTGRERYELTIAGGEEEAQRLRSVLPVSDDIEVEGRRATLKTADAERAQPLVDAARGAGLTIVSLRAVRPSLEDLFMEAVHDPETGGRLKPGASKESGKR